MLLLSVYLWEVASDIGRGFSWLTLCRGVLYRVTW